MSIVSLEMTVGSWKLNRTCFGNRNLLVGISGAGKTKTLQSLRILHKAGLTGAMEIPPCQWKMEFLIDGHSYLWQGQIQSELGENNWSFEDQENEPSKNTIFLSEYIEKSGVVLVERDHSKGIFNFGGVTLPKLKWTESAITLLSSEEDLMPLQSALRCIVSSDESEDWYYEALPHKSRQWNSLSELQSATRIPLLVRAKDLQDQYPDRFNEIKSYFIDIFEFVENIEIVNVLQYFPGKYNPRLNIWTLVIRERDGDSSWIAGSDISSGMLRTLKLLLELALVPKGTLFLIDEFENSLGINCLPQVADIVASRQGEIQFILTSHHPYVINNIPWSEWKLVTRHGSTVTIHDVSEIPTLQTRSSLDRFHLLINAPEYQEGIA